MSWFYISILDTTDTSTLLMVTKYEIQSSMYCAVSSITTRDRSAEKWQRHHIFIVIGSTAINFTLVTRSGCGGKIVIYFCWPLYIATLPYLHCYWVLNCLSIYYVTTINIFATYQFCYIWIGLSLQISVKLLSLPPKVLFGKSRLFILFYSNN